MIQKILIANRGEIACRVARSCDRLGIPTATVHSTADRFSRHVRVIGESIELGPPPAAESYLDIAGVIQAAQQVGADAIHPGYGFLSENANAARAVEAAGLTWIGPRSETIEEFGDKAKSKVLASAAGVPVIPGVDGAYTDPSEIADAVKQVGLPVLLKAAAGGGGKGMRLVESLDDIEQAIEQAMSEALRSFGSAELMVERYLVDARHIEAQIAGDGQGDVIHFFERECSLQRRHQKIIEEAPASNLSDGLRQRILDAACNLGRHVSYRGIATVEFIVTGDEFYFLEVNPRIQVEHPVTEQITGIDLVELQLQIANGAGLGIQQDQVVPRGHAIEARVYAEDPDQGFLPVVGTITRLDLPDPVNEKTGLRVECSVDSGDEVTSHYDPMIAKLIVWAPDRQRALLEMGAVLGSSHVDGVTTNLPFLRNLVLMPAVVKGDYHTRFVEEAAIKSRSQPNPETLAIVAALWLRSQRALGASGPWGSWPNTMGWRLSTGEPMATCAPIAVLSAGEKQWQVRSFPILENGSIRLAIDDQSYEVALSDTGQNSCLAAVGSISIAVRYQVNQNSVFVSGAGFEARIDVATFLTIVSTGSTGSGQGLTAPMTGQVLRVLVNVGDRVKEGDVIAVMESMKLELQIATQHAGIVAAVHCTPDTVIERGMVIADIEQDDDE
jgi:3-methylcrotonyl-CoA carboxylase alpha subunit